jgi:lysophospholipase L1-like esterase
MTRSLPVRLAALCSAIFALALSNLDAQALVRVMPLGDSITYGMGAGPAMIPGGYRDPLAHDYVALGDSFVFVGSDSTNTTPYLIATGQQNNEGHTGYRIDQIQSNIDAWQASAAPDMVLLHIGTNDILQNFNLGTGVGNDTSAAIARLTTLISTLYANNPSLKIVLSTLIPIQDARDLYVKNYNAALASTVVPNFTGQGRSIVLVDNYANFVNPDGSWISSLYADYAHPNATGYAAMATTYATVALPVVQGITFSSLSAAGVAGEDSAIQPNLVTAGQGTLASVTAPTGSISSAFPVSGLNDGSAATNANYTYYSVNDAANGATTMPDTVTFQLNTAVNTSGYDITSVQAISGWGDHNLGAQRFQLLLSRNNEEFVNYGTYTNANTVNGGDSSFLSTVSHSSGTLATHVTGVRFVFLNPDPANGDTVTGPSQAVSNGGTVIHELQVFGTASAILPPPPCILTAASSAGYTSQDTAITSNLLRQGQSTLSSVTAPTGSLPGNFSVTGLNDGSAAGTPNMTYYSVVDTNGGATTFPVTVTFALNTGVNTAGYDITSIQAISGWTDHSLGAQRFQLLLSLNNGTYTDYGTYRNADTVNGTGAAYLSTLTGASGTIAKNVTGIRFVFLNPDASNGVGSVGTSQAGGGSSGGTVIHELQAFGTPSTGTAPSYASWAGDTWHFTGDDALPDSDPNHNGISNLLEYALGGDPSGSTTGLGILPKFAVVSGTPAFSFTRYLDRTDIDLSVEVSDDLVTWTEIAHSTHGAAFASTVTGVTVSETGVGNARPVVISDLPVPNTPGPHTHFARLHVIQ